MNRFDQFPQPNDGYEETWAELVTGWLLRPGAKDATHILVFNDSWEPDHSFPVFVKPGEDPEVRATEYLNDPTYNSKDSDDEPDDVRLVGIIPLSGTSRVPIPLEEWRKN